MEEKKLLPKIPLNLFATITLAVFLMNLFAPCVHADSFSDSLTTGKALGDGVLGSYVPGNVDMNIIPNYNAAQGQQGTFTGFYTNPGGMQGAASGEALDFIKNSYETRQHYDLSNDPTFGTGCLERDAEGNCTMWSLSKELFDNTYPDCNKVLIPEYETSNTATCTDAATFSITPECTVRKYIDTQVEYVEGPCGSMEFEIRPDQIYAICKENYEMYRINMGTVSNPPSDWAGVRAGLCSPIGGCDCFGTCPTDAVTVAGEGDLPEGSQCIFQGVVINWCVGDSGERVCNATWYKYYLHQKPSIVERVYLRSDQTCSDESINEWSQECSLWDYIKCDSAGLNCVYLVQNGYETGNTSDTECEEYPSVMGAYGYSSILYDTNAYNNCVAGCPTYLANFRNCTVGDGESAVYCDYCESCALCVDACVECTGCSCPPNSNVSGAVCYHWDTITDPTCQAACYNASALALNGYNVCMPPDGLEGVTLNNQPVTTTPSATMVFNTAEGSLSVQWKALFGGPGAEDRLNNWYTKMRFQCKTYTNTCNTLVEQGCVLFGQRCLDDECNQHEYTYKCGEDRVTGYKVTYNCAGTIRCVGTDCKSVSYDANNEFGAAASAGEILNQARIDSNRSGTNFQIFPGKELECQSGPENCCRPTTGGVSIADYISAAKAMYDIYNYAANGIAGVAEGYAANITSVGNWLASNTGFTAATTTTVEAGGIATTTTVVETGLGTTTMTTTMAAEGMTASATMASPSMAINMIGNVAAVVGILVTAYTVANMIYDQTFACTDEDFETSVKVGFKLCHLVGTRSTRKLGFFTQRWNQYCCFNSILARIVHEQGRPQLGIGWGGGIAAPNCRGLSVQELGSIDFSQIDLTEYIQHVTHKTSMTQTDIDRISNSLKNKLP